MSELYEFGKKVLGEQAFSTLLGAKLVSLEPGEAVLEIPVRDELKQQHGFVHGGVVSFLADNALTFAGGSILGNSVTSEFKINYVRPAVGARLAAHASVMSAGKTQAVCACKIFADGEKGQILIAIAQGTIRKVE